MTDAVLEAPPKADSMQITLLPPSGDVLLREARSMQSTAAAIVIDSNDMLEIANGELGDVKTRITALEAKQKEILEPLATVEKNVRALFREPLRLLNETESTLKLGISNWMRKEQARIAEEKRKAEEEARRTREAAARESARIEAEAKERAAKLEAEAKAAAAAGDVGRAAALEVKAQQAEETGYQRAADVSAQGQMVVAAPVAAAPKAAGVSLRTTWKGRVKDKAKALAFIADKPQFHHLVEFDVSAITALAKAMKTGLETAVPGLEAYEEFSVSKRN